MNVLILTTGKGANFARSIGQRIRRQPQTERVRVYRYRVASIDLAFANHPEFNPQNTIILCRAAHPTAQWMVRLRGLEEQGYRVINNTNSLRLTSDKLGFWDWINACGLATESGNEVLTSLLPRNPDQAFLDGIRAEWSQYSPNGVVIKPRYSQGQGTHVHKLPWTAFVDRNYVRQIISTMPHCPLVIQEVIDYAEIYRVVTINGGA